MKNLKISVILLFGLLFATMLVAQTKGKTDNSKNKKIDLNTKVQVETRDDNSYIGELIEDNDKQVKIKTDKLGEITIQKSDILTIAAVSKNSIKNNEVWFENPNATRYLYGPSAFSLKEGEGYYQNTLVFFNQASYGFSDRFTCGIGVVPLFLISRDLAEYSPIFITPKFTLTKSESPIQFGVGAIAVGLPFSGERGSLGILYGVGTAGDKDKNVSVGLGWGFSRSAGEGNIADKPTITVSGMYRLSKKGYLVSENWFPAVGEDDNFVLLSLAYRHVGKSVSVDLGVLNSLDGFGYPWLGVTIPFKKK